MAYRRTERVMQRLNARREAVVVAARDLAAEAGMQAVQVVPVADRAGIAAGTVYRYFPSKGDLVAALADKVMAREVAAVRRAADAAPGPLSALAAAIVTLAARCALQRRLMAAMLLEPADHDFEALRLRCRRQLADELAARIAAAVTSDLLPQQDVVLASATLIGGLLEGLIGPLAGAGGDAASTRDAVQAVTLAALRGLGVVDARARGLVVQAPWPADVAWAANPTIAVSPSRSSH